MIDETLVQLEDLVLRKIPLSPSGWLDIIGRIVVEMGDETDKLYALQRRVSVVKVNMIQDGKSVAEAKAKAESTEMYEEMQKQKAKCLKIEELIRIGKLQSKLKEGEFRAGNL